MMYLPGSKITPLPALYLYTWNRKYEHAIINNVIYIHLNARFVINFISNKIYTILERKMTSIFYNLLLKSEIMHYQNVSLKITNTENLNDIYTLNHEKFQTTNVFIDTAKKWQCWIKWKEWVLLESTFYKKKKYMHTKSLKFWQRHCSSKSVLASVYPDPRNLDSDSILICVS